MRPPSLRNSKTLCVCVCVCVCVSMYYVTLSLTNSTIYTHTHTLLKVYEPNEEKSDDSKDTFYEELEQLFDHFQNI